MDQSGPFTLADLRQLDALVIDAWRSGLDRDWSAPAGTLDWDCAATADHTVDCVFSYAFFLASRVEDAYPPFGELHALPEATPADLVAGLRATTTMLEAVIDAAPPDARAVIFSGPPARTGTPADFAARGALELTLHAHDVCSGLGIAFTPPAGPCERLRDHTAPWPAVGPTPVSADPWSDLLERSGRPRLA